MTNESPTPDDRLLLHALLDGELDPAHALEIERKIAADPQLAAERARLQALQRALREKVPVKPLPAHVRMRVERAIGLGAAPARTGRAISRPSWTALAASIAVALMVGSASTYLALAPGNGERIAEEVADDHLRALMAAQPYEVASSDRHTVKPWFNGKIPQAPRVVDLAGQDFPLVGGRIDVIGGEAVPALVYRHRQHLISVSAVPDSKAAAAPIGRRTVRGYNLIGWRDGGTAYWAVSDLGAGELDAFVQAFRNAPAE
ncbi:MAG TPA: anti-sigma factor [Xanthobacteraceae bacterium]|nr:anti-sigma factor [Xanthobacteraceae bacterium]